MYTQLSVCMTLFTAQQCKITKLFHPCVVAGNHQLTLPGA